MDSSSHSHDCRNCTKAEKQKIKKDRHQRKGKRSNGFKSTSKWRPFSPLPLCLLFAHATPQSQDALQACDALSLCLVCLVPHFLFPSTWTVKPEPRSFSATSIFSFFISQPNFYTLSLNCKALHPYKSFFWVQAGVDNILQEID